MTATIATATAKEAATARPPSCQARRGCINGHQQGCDRPATLRLTMLCEEPECDCAIATVLACDPCMRRFIRQVGPGRVVARPV